MRCTTGLTTRALILISLMFFTGAVMAIMPPAPPEWYERIDMPMPENIKNGVYPNFDVIEKDLARAAKRQPNNTDNLLLILVEFSDNPADQLNHPPQAFDDMMFSTGVVPTGSLVEYYQEISYGAFTPAGTVTVWITAPHPYTYYSDGSYGTGSYPNNSQGLLEDCIEILDLAINFSQFDNDGDGYAEGIFLVHAGPGAEETGDPDDIWSHAWYYEVETDDGTMTGRYSTEPEEHYDGSMVAIGVYCHEYGHVLGMPDLYDTDGTSEGIGVYCLMAGGSWGALPGNPERPTHMSAEMKRRLGWLTPTTVSGNLIDLIIPPVATIPICYQVFNPSDPDEYFLIENRGKVGFDSLFRGDGGLAIWHVDWDGWQQNEAHRYVSLEQADGNGDLERDYGTGNRHPRTNRGDAGDLYPGSAGNTYFSFSSHPSSYSYNDPDAFLTLNEIEMYGDSVRLDLYAAPDVPIYRFASLEINDTAAVSGTPDFDGEADSDEIIELVVSLACDGEGASSLLGTIVSSDSRVTILDGSGTFSASTHNDYTTNAADPFRVQINSAGSDSAVTFNLSLDADGDACNLQFKMNINRQKILIVLDNNGSHWSDNVVKAMHQSGYSFDVYSVAESGTTQYDDLIPYHAVLWTTASYFGTRTSSGDYEYCLTTEETDVLSDYLDNAGRLGLFSQDYIYDRGVDAFASGYLHASGGSEDQIAQGLTGIAGTVYDGYVGNLKEWSFYDYTDFLYASGGAEVVMEESSTGGNVMLKYPSTPQIGLPATTFSSFSIERLDDASLGEFLSLWSSYILTDINIEVPIPTMPADNETVSVAPVFVWTASGGAVSYNIQVATDFDFTNIIRDTSVPSNSTAFAQPFDNGEYFWRVNASPASKTASAYSPRSRFVIYAPYMCGDANDDDGVNVGDAVYVIAYVFKGGPPPPFICQGDANGDGDVNVGDAVYLISYVFKGGPGPVEPCCQ